MTRRPARSACILLLTSGMISCATEPAPQAPSDALQSWVTDLAANPDGFGTLMEKTGRDGWIAMHEHRYADALDAFEGDAPEVSRARVRAAFDEHSLRSDLARLSTFASQRLFDTWAARGGVPADGIATSVAALASWCGTGELGDWAATVDQAGPGGALLTHLAQGGVFATFSPEVGANDPDDPFANRAVAHAAAMQGDDRPLLQAAQAPLIVQVDSGKEAFERSFYDPCAHNTLADSSRIRLVKELGSSDWSGLKGLSDGGLESTLFAQWNSGTELANAVGAANSPADVMLHLTGPSQWGFNAGSPDPDENDDLEQARVMVQQLDEHLAAWRVAQEGHATGMALVRELGLVERLRQHQLTTIARQALLDGRIQQARVWAEASFDPAEREVGAGNAPTVLTLVAEARLRQGHTREALDALQILVKARPDVGGIVEVVADLSVLEGLDRRGDSKEH